MSDEILNQIVSQLEEIQKEIDGIGARLKVMEEELNPIKVPDGKRDVGQALLFKPGPLMPNELMMPPLLSQIVDASPDEGNQEEAQDN